MPLYIAQSGQLSRMPNGLTDWLTTLKDRATQLRIMYKSGALVTQCKETRWLSGSPLSLLSARIGERERRMRKMAWPLNPSTLKPISILTSVHSTQCDILSLSPCVHPLKYLPPFEIHNSQSHCWTSFSMMNQLWISISEKMFCIHSQVVDSAIGKQLPIPKSTIVIIIVIVIFEIPQPQRGVPNPFPITSPSTPLSWKPWAPSCPMDNYCPQYRNVGLEVNGKV